MSFDIRETRLRNDYQRVRDLANRSELIHIIRTEGDPPEKYLIRFTCRGVEGIGGLTAAALTMAFERGAFQSADAFIAFLGLDVRAKDSGTFTGRRKLTKQGDPEIRRLLHNAALAAARKGHWKQLYEQYQARGLRKTQALVILARKLARIAFALMKKREDYIPRTA